MSTPDHKPMACSAALERIAAEIESQARITPGATKRGKLKEWAHQLRALELNPDLPVAPHQCDECKEPFFTSGQVLCAIHKRRTRPPGEIWVGPFANSTRVWATRQAYLDEVEPHRAPDIDPRVYEPRLLQVQGAPPEQVEPCGKCKDTELIFEAMGWPCNTCDTTPRVLPLSKQIYCSTPCEGEAAYSPAEWIAKQKEAAT